MVVKEKKIECRRVTRAQEEKGAGGGGEGLKTSMRNYSVRTNKYRLSIRLRSRNKRSGWLEGGGNDEGKTSGRRAEKKRKKEYKVQQGSKRKKKRRRRKETTRTHRI